MNKTRRIHKELKNTTRISTLPINQTQSTILSTKNFQPTQNKPQIYYQPTLLHTTKSSTHSTKHKGINPPGTRDQ